MSYSSHGNYLHTLLENSGITRDDALRSRACADCSKIYTILENARSCEQYFTAPWNYISGCLTRCLSCWLDVSESTVSEPTDFVDLLHDCGMWLGPQEHLVLLPLARAVLDEPIRLPIRLNLYPASCIELQALNIVANSDKSSSLAEVSSAVSRVDAEVIAQHATVAFAFRFDWEAMSTRWSHASHMEFIRALSAYVDDQCLDAMRYQQCRIEPVDNLSGRAGQLDSNHMMAGAFVYNAARQEGRVLGGAAFTHIVTKGIGLPVEALPEIALPSSGETGMIVKQALSLYSTLLESNSPTAKFIQAIALLEFLADPFEYRKFEEVKKIVGRYVAQTPAQYQLLLERLFELTGKKDTKSGQVLGYRTRIVHFGERLDQILPSPLERRKLFEELDSYIRAMIDHMMSRSSLAYEAYLKTREEIRCWQSRR